MEYRFDLGAKLFYVKCVVDKIDTNYFKEMYFKHIETFNGCWEYPGDKTDIEQFYDAFNKLIEDMMKNGYNSKYPVHIGNNGIIINGSHRLITSKYLGIEPFINLNKEIGGVGYNYDFFIHRTEKKPLDVKYADFIALNNLELFKDQNCVRSVVVYPIANKLNKNHLIEDILSQYGTIMYKKRVNLNRRGVSNLIKEMYRGENWIGGVFPNDDCGGKFDPCYADYPVEFYLFCFKDPVKDVEMKNRVREIFNMGKHSVHATDTYVETFRVASTLLNDNSIHFLNHATNNISQNSKNMLVQYFDKVKYDENYCITSGMILELYGLRTTRDLDYLNRTDNDIRVKNITPHCGEWLQFYPYCKDEIIFNPNNYFYFNGHKVATLDILMRMKQIRGEEKDIRDIELIKKINLKNQSVSLFHKYMLEDRKKYQV